MTALQLPRQRPPGIEIEDAQRTLENFARSHVGDCPAPLGIARPRDERQVEELVLWANRHGIALVPVSSPGGPRRRGDTAPAKPALVVDLSRMDRLVHADARDAIAIIEPGLTFPEFDEKLRPYRLRAFKPLLPRRTKSVLAAYLEREPMTAVRDHWDTSDPLAALSVTFGSGETFRTGTAGIPGTLEENLKRGNRQMMSPGPIASDYTRVLLGSQGTLGIVSWGSIYCERIPAREEAYFYGADDYAAVAELARVLALRQLGAHCFILDSVQAAAALGHGGDAFASDARVPRWLLYVAISAADVSPDACMAWQRTDLAELAKAAGTRLVDDVDGFGAGVLAARMSDLPVTPYKDAPLGAHREVFCLTQLDKVADLIAAVQPLLVEAKAGGIVAGIYVQPTIQGSSCHLEFTLFHAPQAAAQAETTEQRMIEALAGAGGFLSRPYARWSDVAYQRDPDIVPYLRKVKDMFDPNNVLNPNRLCF